MGVYNSSWSMFWRGIIVVIGVVLKYSRSRLRQLSLFPAVNGLLFSVFIIIDLHFNLVFRSDRVPLRCFTNLPFTSDLFHCEERKIEKQLTLITTEQTKHYFFATYCLSIFLFSCYWFVVFLFLRSFDLLVLFFPTKCIYVCLL